MERAIWKWITAPVILILFLIASQAFAQGRPTQPAGNGGAVVYVNEEGDVFQEGAIREGKIHLQGYFKVASADYFRGVLDGVPEGWNDYSFQPTLAVIADTWRGVSFTAGIQNGLSDKDPYRNAESPEWWYDANPYFGLAGRLPSDILAGFTYTAHTSPNRIQQNWEEFALSLKYDGANGIGWLQPSVKAAAAVSGRDGVFLSVGIEPHMIIGRDVTLSLPIVLGSGFDNYYRSGWDGFVSGSLVGSVPLRFLTPDYGNWRLNAGLHLIVRDDNLEDIGKPFDDASNSVFYASIGVSFLY